MAQHVGAGQRVEKYYNLYKVLGLFYPVWNSFFPKYVCTLEYLGLTMINVVLHGSDKPVLENTDITRLAKTT